MKTPLRRSLPAWVALLLWLTAPATAWAQTPYALAGGTYTEGFAGISGWANNFAGGTGAAPYAAVPAGTTPPNQTAVFTSGQIGGVQKGTGAIVLLATGTTDGQNGAAFDLLLDFTGTTAGTVSLDWATVFNSTGDRRATFKLQTNTGTGGAFVDLPGSSVVVTNNVTAAGSLTAVALPAAFSGNAGARLRFFLVTSSGGSAGSRPKISLDNVAVTAPATSAGPGITTGTVAGSPFCVPAASAGPAFSVPYTATGGLSGAFAVQLSSATGAFATDLTQNLIGQGSSSPLAASIPAGTAAGTGYRVRVVHGTSATAGAANAQDLTVTTPPASNPVTLTPSTAPQSITTTGTGSQLTATPAAPSSVAWFYGTNTAGPFSTAIAGATTGIYTPAGADFGGAGTYYLVARATSSCGSVVGTSAPVTVTVSAPAPVLTVTPLTVPDFGGIAVGSPSGSQAVSVAGQNLTAPVVFTPPAGFEIRTGTAAFACCALTLTPTGGALSATVDVRFVPAQARAYADAVAVATTDVPGQSPVNVSGTGLAAVYPATVRTDAVGTVTTTSAQLNGTVVADGGAPVTERGVVYAQTAFPTLDDDAVAAGSGLGSFTATLGGLQASTLYYARAYATNSVGTVYGEPVSFTTSAAALAPEPAQSSTLTATAVAPTTVTLAISGGDGAKKLVLVTQAPDLTATPADGTGYAANARFGQGDQPTPGTYVVLAAAAADVTVTGLQPNTEYTFAVFDYNDNNTTGAENYRLTNPGVLTLTTPVQPPQVLLLENFGYAAGQRLTDNGWGAHSAAGTNPILVSGTALSRADYDANGGGSAAVGASGEDVNRPLAADVSPGTPVYAAFLVQVTAAGSADYFFHLGPNPISTTYRARVLVRAGSTSGKVQFGVSGSGTAPVYAAGEYDLGRPQLLVVRYVFGLSGTETVLFVNPGAAEPTTPDAVSTEPASSAPAAIGTVALRQGSSASSVLVDGLRVATSYTLARTSNTPLPVTWTSFRAVLQGESQAVLRWATAQEKNSACYVVERSRDGQAFAEAGRVAAAGQSTTARTYEWRDPQPLRQLTYYRLRQVDADGTVHYSQVVTLAPQQGEAKLAQVFPNPTAGQPVRLVLRGYQGQAVQVRVTDVLGHTVLTQAFTPAAYLSEQPLALPAGLVPGVYAVRVQAGSHVQQMRLLVTQ